METIIKKSIGTSILAIMICCTSVVTGQNGSSSSNIIGGKGYEVVDDTLRITTPNNDIYMLPTEQINASVSVDKESNSVVLESTARGGSMTQSLDHDVVVLNIEGVTIVTKSDNEEQFSIHGSTDVSATQTMTKSGSNTKSFETTILAGGGIVLSDEFVPMINGKIREMYCATSNFKVGLGLGGEIYAFPAFAELNYHNSYKMLYMANLTVGLDLSLWGVLGCENRGVPAWLTTDTGYGVGYGIGSNWYKGFTFSPGLMWYLLEFSNESILCASLNYKYQQFNNFGHINNLLINIGYKF